MQQFKIKDKTISIPTTWNDITLKQYMMIQDLTSVDDNDDDNDNLFHTIAIYCNIDVDTVKQMHINDVKVILNELSKVTTTQIEKKAISEFHHSGETYTVIDTLLNAQFQDFLSLEGLLNENKGKEHKVISKIIAILAKKKGETLDTIEISSRARLFESLPLPIAYNLNLFFYQVANRFTVDYKDQLREIDTMINSYRIYIDATTKKQGGMGYFSRLLMGILRKYTKYLTKKWNSYFSGYNSKKESKL